MTRRPRITAPDVVACVPLLGCVVLLLLGAVESVLRGWWPDAPRRISFSDVHVMANFLIVFPLSFLAIGATGLHTLLVTLSDVVEGRWQFGVQRRLLGRAALCAVGYVWLFFFPPMG